MKLKATVEGALPVMISASESSVRVRGRDRYGAASRLFRRLL